MVSDRVKVAQIATNLLSNAIKYQKAQSETPAVVRLEFQTISAECWGIIVADTGLGIAPSDLEGIFDEFYRVSAVGITQGTGLGLAIVKSLVDALDGTISVESELGGGSRFEVKLPKG